MHHYTLRVRAHASNKLLDGHTFKMEERIHIGEKVPVSLMELPTKSITSASFDLIVFRVLDLEHAPNSTMILTGDWLP